MSVVLVKNFNTTSESAAPDESQAIDCSDGFSAGDTTKTRIVTCHTALGVVEELTPISAGGPIEYMIKIY